MFLCFNEFLIALLTKSILVSFALQSKEEIFNPASRLLNITSIVVYEPVTDKNIFEKSLLQRERNLITFVERFETHNIMDRTTIEDALFPDCPIRNILARLCDKWSLLVIYTLDKAGKEKVRFKELQREIPDISQKMLTVTLRTLEDDGYLTRTVYPEVPPRVEYALTERTRSLLPHIDALIEWALENKDAIIKDRKKANR